MTLEPKAGPCKGNNGRRHAWGPERPLQRGTFATLTQQKCQRCPRVKVIEYTGSANHVAGYSEAE